MQQNIKSLQEFKKQTDGTMPLATNVSAGLNIKLMQYVADHDKETKRNILEQLIFDFLVKEDYIK